MGNPGAQEAGGDAAELHLAAALRHASAAGQWVVVELLARELETRRKSKQLEETGVIDLDAERKRRT